ncbi:MAG: radical SAM protein, partial [Candidatus Omnitrophica bacterium]|nr:radical SAM protein [Candidatus Omnitrophota bacterium]
MEELFSALPCDMYIRDDGTAFLEVARIFLREHKSLSHEQFLNIPNIVLSIEGKIIRTEEAKTQSRFFDINCDIPVAVSDITHGKAYNKSSAANLEQGFVPLDRVGRNPLPVYYGNFCQRNCIFCDVERNSHRAPPANEVLKIIDEHIFNHDSVNFDCADFLTDYDFTKELILLLQQRAYSGIPKKATACVNHLEGDGAMILPEMYKAGFRLLAFGIESFNDFVLQRIGKRTTRQQNINALEKTLAAGIKPGINIILFTPWDTIESTIDTIEQSLNFVERGAYVNVVYRVQARYGTAFSRVKNVIEYDQYEFEGMRGKLRAPTHGRVLDDNLERLANSAFRKMKGLEKNYESFVSNTVCVYGLLLFKAFGLAYAEEYGYTQKIFEMLSRIDKAIEQTIEQMEDTIPFGRAGNFYYKDYADLDVAAQDKDSSLRMRAYIKKKFPAEVFNAIRQHTNRIEIHRGPLSRTKQHIENLRNSGFDVRELSTKMPVSRKFYAVEKAGDRVYIIANNIGSSRELFVAQVLNLFRYPQDWISLWAFPVDIRHHLLKGFEDYRGKISKAILAHEIKTLVIPAFLEHNPGSQVVEEIHNDFFDSAIIRLSSGKLVLVCDIEYANGLQIKPLFEFFADDEFSRGLGIKEITMYAACGSLAEDANINDILVPDRVYGFGSTLEAGSFNLAHPDEIRPFVASGVKVHRGGIFTIPTVISASKELAESFALRYPKSAIELELAHAVETLRNYPDIKARIIYEIHDKPLYRLAVKRQDALGRDIPGSRKMKKRIANAAGVVAYLLRQWAFEEAIIKGCSRATEPKIDSLPNILFSKEALAGEIRERAQGLFKEGKNPPPLLLGIGGLSGSGKTHYIVPFLQGSLGLSLNIIRGDRFVVPKHLRSAGKGNIYPYGFFNFEAIKQMLTGLKSGQPVAFPLYDHNTRLQPLMSSQEADTLMRSGAQSIWVPYYGEVMLLLPGQNSPYSRLRVNEDSMLGVDPKSLGVVEIVVPGKEIYLFDAAPALFI